jgi:class 3 adenylate cyclase
MARALIEACERMSVRDLLPTVNVPSLILHRRGDRLVPVQHGREVAALMPQARYVELPGDAHLWWLDDDDGLIDEIEEFLTGTRHSHVPERSLATIVFTDVVASTERTAAMGDRAWRELLEAHDALVRREVGAGGGRVIKSMGDGYLAVFDAPGLAIECAQQIVDGSRQLGVEVRAGVHTGECEALGDDVAGMAVNIGARVSALAGPGEVLVSGTVKDLVVGSTLGFAPRGVHELKGVPGEWRLYAVGDAPAPQPGGVGRLDVSPHVPLGGRALLAFARRNPRLSSRLMRRRADVHA